MHKMAKFEIGGAFINALQQHVRDTGHDKYRPDFPLTFSASSEEEVWPFLGFGYSNAEDRRPIKHPFLRAVVREYRTIDETLGRFHVCEEGVFKGEQKRLKDKFILFERGLRFSDEWKIQYSNVQTNAERLSAFKRTRSRAMD